MNLMAFKLLNVLLEILNHFKMNLSKCPYCNCQTHYMGNDIRCFDCKYYFRDLGNSCEIVFKNNIWFCNKLYISDETLYTIEYTNVNLLKSFILEERFEFIPDCCNYIFKLIKNIDLE